MDSLQHLTTAMLPAIMGHFETYERYLFAGVFDRSVYLHGFSVADFVRSIVKAKESEVSIDLIRLAAHRQLGVSSVGMLLADSLTGWQNPKKVNAYFGAFGLRHQLFGNDHCTQLSVLWQLRHSIVHTGGTLTLPDSQKVRELSGLGGRKVVFEDNFIFEVARKLHPLVKSATEGLATGFNGRLVPDLTAPVRQGFNDFFAVRSSVAVWLR